MLQGFKGLLDSKKALAGGLLMICATVLVALGKMTVENWQDFATYIFITYAGAETVNGVAATMKGHGTSSTKTTKVEENGKKTLKVEETVEDKKEPA